VKRAAVLGLVALPGVAFVLIFGFGRPAGRETGERIVEPLERLAKDAQNLQSHEIPVSDREENEFGRRLALELAKDPRVDRADPELRRYLSRVGNSLLVHVRRRAIEYEFHVLDSEGVNAYSLPGGKIYVTRGMLQVVETEAELAAILGHEMAHVDLGHCIDRVRTRISAERRGVRRDPLQDTIRAFIDRAHGESLEYDADRYGAGLAGRAGYDARGLADLFTRMEDEARTGPKAGDHRRVDDLLAEAIRTYERTHPPFERRVDRLLEFPRGGYRGVRNYRERKARADARFPE
jgi:predicted Zn-dependent protease